MQQVTDFSFETLYCKWLEEMKYVVSENTWDSYWLIARIHLLPHFSDRSVCEIEQTDIQDYYLTKLKQGLCNTTVRRHYANLHKFFNWLVYCKIISQNPVIETNQLIASHGLKFQANFLTMEELKECISLFQGHKLEIPVMLAAMLGLRRSEIAGLTWDCINLKAKTLIVKQVYVKSTDREGKQRFLFKNKTKSPSGVRLLPLPDSLCERLLLWKQLQKYYQIMNEDFCKDYLNFVFLHSSGKPYTPDFITRAFHERIKKENFKKVRFHDLRHSCATMLLDLQYSLPDIQSWLGHSDLATTSLYLHTRMTTKKRMAIDVDRALK